MKLFIISILTFFTLFLIYTEYVKLPKIIKNNKILFYILTIIFYYILLKIKNKKLNKKPGIQNIIIIRHAEKPENDLGQLNCKGLNRALALPTYFEENFPEPDYIFAPKPILRDKSTEKNAKDSYYYERPLITIEPTAIKNSLPVNIGIAAGDPSLGDEALYSSANILIKELLSEKYRSSTIFLAWEHVNIPIIAKLLLKKFNVDSSNIPRWKKDDFDSVYVFKIVWNTDNISFRIDKQGLDYVSNNC